MRAFISLKAHRWVKTKCSLTSGMQGWTAHLGAGGGKGSKTPFYLPKPVLSTPYDLAEDTEGQSTMSSCGLCISLDNKWGRAKTKCIGEKRLQGLAAWMEPVAKRIIKKTAFCRPPRSKPAYNLCSAGQPHCDGGFSFPLEFSFKPLTYFDLLYDAF